MEATFNFHTTPELEDKYRGSIIVNSDEEEISIFDERGCELVTFYIGSASDLISLKYLNNTLNSLIREME